MLKYHALLWLLFAFLVIQICILVSFVWGAACPIYISLVICATMSTYFATFCESFFAMI